MTTKYDETLFQFFQQLSLEIPRISKIPLFGYKEFD
jgi:hypothetical protein